jgi:hypothetical protein
VHDAARIAEPVRRGDPIADRIWLTGPANENRNSHSTVIATELVTDGK